MALDFYEMDDIRLQKILFSLDDKQLNKLHDLFEEFRKLTGNYINPYGTNRIYQDHIELILSLIKGHLNTNTKKDNKQIFMKIVVELSKSKNGLLAIGD